ncbi:ladderlectin-like isoform X1 [Procambarus clarkii]|uniref:ladderlectin-like isoform X1 n=1 Tax=Procambarus clarkii TaxID=6728 RepID=UPI001E676683|nr:tetranectin-like isoform X1 [Procambarus clarkii]
MATFSAILLSVLALVTAAQEIQTLQDLSNTLLLNQLAMSNMLAERDSRTRVIREWLNDLQSNITSEIAALQNVVKANGVPQDAGKGVVECMTPFVDVYGHCILVETALTGSWETMRRHCQQKGGEIVKVDCGTFMYYLVRYLHSNGLVKLSYWVGGRDEGHEGSFFWTDGTQVKMGTPFWGDGITDNIQEPDGGTDQNCMLMYKEDHYFFFDTSCNNNYAVICEKLKLS